jgi:hypothetical protein
MVKLTNLIFLIFLLCSIVLNKDYELEIEIGDETELLDHYYHYFEDKETEDLESFFEEDQDGEEEEPYYETDSALKYIDQLIEDIDESLAEEDYIIESALDIKLSQNEYLNDDNIRFQTLADKLCI